MNSRARVVAALTLILAVGVVFSGCGSSKPPIAITLGPSGTQNVVAGQAVNVTATVANDSKTAGVTWSLTGSGALSAQTTTSVTYTAPSPISANSTATITATSVSDTTKTATMTINLQAISVAVSPSSATVTSGTNAPFTATVSNDPGNKGVTWTVTCSVAQCGSVPPGITASGTATTYTAPTTAPTTALAVTLTATSVSDTTKSNSATITVPAVAISVAPTTATVQATATQQFTATVTNTSSQGVTWTLTQGGAACTAACGTLNSATANPVTYTAPAPPASALTITITATAAADHTKSSSATITVPAISVAVAPPTASVPVKGTQSFTATVSNDAANKGVTWTLTQGGAACSPGCGTITATTASGAPATYMAPATVPANPAVTVNAASVADLTKTATATATVVGITVSVSPTTQSVVVNATQQFTATVANDVSNSGVTWTLTQGGVACAPTCGTVAPTTTATGSPTTYTAPASVPATPTVTLTATSVANATKFASATITVTAAPPINVSISPSNPTVTVNATKQFTATVANDPAAKGVTWTLTQSGVACSPVCGSVSPTSGAGNAPTTTYTAPATVPTPATVTITATSAADATKSASTTITVTAAAACTKGGNASLLSGGYAMLLKGFDSSGNPALVGGVLTFDGAGNISAGTVDMNLNSGFTSNTVTSVSFYGVDTTDDRGCMVITTAAGTQNYRFSLGNISGTPAVASTGHVIGFDTSGPFTSGIMRKQSGGPFSNASANGSYAFGGSSPQNAAQGGGKFGLVGVITFNGNGVITGGSEDINQQGTLDGNPANTTWPTNPLSINGTTSTYTISANGRGSEAVGVIGTPVIFNSVIYVVSSSEALFMTSDSQTAANHNTSAGVALLQSGTPFSTNPLSGAYIGYQSALGSTAGTSRTSLLLINVSGSSITGTQLRNDGGSFQSQSLTGITYSVTSSGRMTVSGGGGGAGPIFYLVSPNQAFILNGNSGVDTGFFQSQTGTSASGTYAFGAIDPQDLNVSDESGVATFTPATTNVSGTSDHNGSGGPSLNQTFNQTYSIDSTGLVHLPSGCTISATSTTCQTVIYVISPTKAVVMDIGSTSNTNTRIEVADQ